MNNRLLEGFQILCGRAVIKEITEESSYLRGLKCPGCYGIATHYAKLGRNITVPCCNNNNCFDKAKLQALKLAASPKKKNPLPIPWKKKCMNFLEAHFRN